jgi:hypothetical protein
MIRGRSGVLEMMMMMTGMGRLGGRLCCALLAVVAAQHKPHNNHDWGEWVRNRRPTPQAACWLSRPLLGFFSFIHYYYYYVSARFCCGECILFRGDFLVGKWPMIN